MATKQHYICPIALDLGASTTGVYSALYPANIAFNHFQSAAVEKLAFVATFSNYKKEGYQPLQVSRNQNRHARRGRTRNRQAKRLFTLILSQCFAFDAQAHETAIRYLMNRRGYHHLENQLTPAQLEPLMGQDELQTCLAPFPELQVLAQDAATAAAFIEQLHTLYENNFNEFNDLQQALNALKFKPKKQKEQSVALAALRGGLQAIQQAHQSGARHRRQYFEQIKQDIQGLDQHPEQFCRRLYHALCSQQAVGDLPFWQVFHLLLCHVNNFDLKQLNRIFRQLPPQASAAAVEQCLAQCFDRWIMKSWQLTALKDGSKKSNQRLTEIQALRQDWKRFYAEHPQHCIEFLLKTAPELTIPPYESHTNRRPPSCQTLILNPQQLDQAYPQWRNWLTDMMALPCLQEAASHYQDRLQDPSPEGCSVQIDADEVQARTLQWICDASQQSDPLALNAIWSQLIKRKECQRKGQAVDDKVTTRLAELVAESALPADLLAEVDQPQPGQFWHFINRYFKTRQGCHQGRYFLHYDVNQAKSSRWQRAGQLLVMCQHRPKQLRHQATVDVAAALGIAPDALQRACGQSAAEVQSLDEFFKEIKGLKESCKNCAQAQKKAHIHYKTQLLDQLDKGKKEVQALQATVQRLQALIQKLALAEHDQQRLLDYVSDPIAAAFLAAKLYPLVWGERSGFAKTCPVCSLDNALRMSGAQGNASASRLKTLSMRLIDGALKRILTHQAYHISHKIWDEQLKENLSLADRISVPIILEQNRFTFSDQLQSLKQEAGQTAANKSNASDKDDKAFDKKKRIQQAGHGICPYTGQSIGGEQGDIDHIIPRTSAYGMLNDEGNLIYASLEGNRQRKHDHQLTLVDLDAGYLQKQFASCDLQTISQQIEADLGYCAQREHASVLAHYHQFRSLNPAQQRAFRHALF